LSSSWGCKRIVEEAIKGAKRSIGGDGGAAVVATHEVDEDQALGEKLNGYIRDCMNRFSKQIHLSEQRYYSWVDEKKGPTGKERNVGGLHEISSDPAQCKAAIVKSNAASPRKPEVEKMGDAYAAALGALVPVVNDAYKYYDRGDYKDDKLAKAQQLHPQLVAVFSAFDKADSDLSKAVDQMQEELDRRELARLEKGEGKKAHWHTVQTTLLAKALLQESAKDVNKINLGALTAASEAYEKEVDAFDAWVTQNKSEAGNVSSYVSSAQRLLVAGKNLVRRLRDKKPYSSTEKSWMGTASGWMVDGSPDEVLSKYNDVISAYNSVRF
jgi:2-succinyl-5-enolpyruvyl-6-hydroxy-3-cyclohexene-1-carboxylate synthase